MRNDLNQFKLHIYESALGENEKEYLLSMMEGTGSNVANIAAIIAGAAAIALLLGAYIKQIEKEQREWDKWVSKTTEKMDDLEQKFQEAKKLQLFDKSKVRNIISQYREIGRELESRYNKYSDEVEEIQGTITAYQQAYATLKSEKYSNEEQESKRRENIENIQKSLSMYQSKLKFAKTRLHQCETLLNRYNRVIAMMERRIF